MSVKGPKKSTFFKDSEADSNVEEVNDKDSIMDKEISNIRISQIEIDLE